MSLDVQFSKVLALRDPRRPGYSNAEYVPERLKQGETHEFKKSGQRIFDLNRAMPLHQTEGNEELSRPLAMIRIVEATHYKEQDKPFTRGKYLIEKVISDNEEVLWEGGVYWVRTKPGGQRKKRK